MHLGPFRSMGNVVAGDGVATGGVKETVPPVRPARYPSIPVMRLCALAFLPQS